VTNSIKVEVTDQMVPMVLLRATFSSLFTMVIRIFLCPWNMTFEAALEAQVGSMANQVMAALEVEGVHRLPGKVHYRCDNSIANFE